MGTLVFPVSSFIMFGDLKTDAGVKALDAFLEEHSYIEGFVPSQADTAVFNGLAKASKAAGDYLGGAAPAADDDDDDVDLFGSESEDEEVSEEKKRITEERLAAYNKKKEGKAKVIAKTSVLLDVKPWADDTDLDEMLKLVKGIEMDGLLWGASKQVPIGYGIKKLTVMCTVEDDKVSVDELQEKIEGFEDHVQSV